MGWKYGKRVKPTVRVAKNGRVYNSRNQLVTDQVASFPMVQANLLDLRERLLWAGRVHIAQKAAQANRPQRAFLYPERAGQNKDWIIWLRHPESAWGVEQHWKILATLRDKYQGV